MQNRMSLGPGSILLDNFPNVQGPCNEGTQSMKGMKSSRQTTTEPKWYKSKSRAERFQGKPIIVENYRTSFNTSWKGKSEKECIRDFLGGITKPNPRRGYLNCRLCNELIWGPNGK